MKDNSAYMIRLELLKLAQSIEIDRSSVSRIRKENDWHQKVELFRLHNEPAPPYPNLEVIDHIRIIQVAKALNEFVSKGD